MKPFEPDKNDENDKNDEKKIKFDFDDESRAGESKIRIIVKKCIFSLLIFVFETFIPMLAGFEMIISLFLYYIITNLMWLIGFKDTAETASGSFVIAAVAGAVLVILIHLLYHIIIDGIFNASLLIEMNAELFAVFLFFTIKEYIDKEKDEILSSAKYVFLAAACIYSIMLAVYFTVKYFKKKSGIHIKYKKL